MYIRIILTYKNEIQWIFFPRMFISEERKDDITNYNKKTHKNILTDL